MAGQVLPCEVHGDGEHKVIALHGWFSDRHAYQSIWPYIDEDAFSYSFVDYRGYGQARGRSGEYTMSEIADDVLATADELGWSEFSLLGHSMGGAAAQRVLLAAPHRVHAIVSISGVPASGVPFDDESWELFSQAWQKRENRRAIIDFTTGSRLTGTWLDAMTSYSWESTSAEAFRMYLFSWGKEDFHQQIDGNPVPVLVVVGEHDPALGPEPAKATWVRWYPHAELHPLADAGHYAADETPIALVSAIEGFLGRQ